MSAIYRKIGGSRAGIFFASYGLNLLRATAKKLILHTPFQIYYFVPNDVIAFVPEYGVFGRLQVLHTLESYPKQIHFWFLGDPDDVIAGIEATGFRPDGANVPPRLKPEPKFILQNRFPPYSSGPV